MVKVKLLKIGMEKAEEEINDFLSTIPECKLVDIKSNLFSKASSTAIVNNEEQRLEKGKFHFLITYEI